ncbi:MAG: tetratricopeptide repeat protein [Oscillospiraceae bacterium]|nr:tetratricopeptide repeat protein [Oscillospiraceae bacterium]
MAEFQVKTKGNASPKGKPRVYFTCHPADFEKYFEKLCQDIFKTHQCAIYYTEDMSAVIEEQDKATDLGSHNLFIVPVTFKLLTQPNRAMDSDIPYALQQHIPVLPFMMEPGIDAVYSRPDKFGELQYLNPYSTDLTEISYEEKLKKYLESVLISDEMAQKVRAAFDAYIFLSYRKKDRRHANELMRLIHSHPELRDIAIWYDEFLTPGKSFKESIDQMLADSDLFALLVTPNLLEEPEGKPNFVMGEEYPAAKKSGIGILPAEMEDTDKAALGEKFDGIPDCVKPDDEAFKPRLIEALSRIATAANDDDPMHNFLIGLAYLEGVDVETDRQRGLELITKAAEADLPEAMEKLYNMYSEGTGVALNYQDAVKWAERLYICCHQNLGEEHPDTLSSLSNLALTYGDLGNYQKALELQEKAYTLCCRILGEEHPDTLASLNNLASTYGDLGDYQKALELKEQAYTLRCRILGEEHPDTLTSLNNLAVTYSDLGDYQKALELKEQAYTLRCRILGEEHPGTLTSLNNLAVTYSDLGDYQKALELLEKAYALRCRILGEEHPDTLASLNNLAITYGDLGDYQKALELDEKAYTLYCRILGEEHPDILTSLNNLAIAYSELGNHKRALELEEKVYALYCRILGEEHPDTLGTLNNLAVTYSKLGDHQKALELKEKVYALRCRILGEDHPDTLVSLHNLAVTYSDLGDHQKALKLGEDAYTLFCHVLGEEHPLTLNSMRFLSALRSLMKKTQTLTGASAQQPSQTGKPKRNRQMAELEYMLLCSKLGKEHPDTQKAWETLQQLYRELGVCQHCGGAFGDQEKCAKCGKPKDY